MYPKVVSSKYTPLLSLSFFQQANLFMAVEKKVIKICPANKFCFSTYCFQVLLLSKKALDFSRMFA